MKSNDTKIRENDIDFARLLKSGKSLRNFLVVCQIEFGKIIDTDITEEVFEQLALFELSLRMHRNNNAPRENNIPLETIINQLKEFKQLTDIETEKLHKGRKFLNNVKRPEKMKSSWQVGLKEFKEAYSLLLTKELVIL